jgi:transposase
MRGEYRKQSSMLCLMSPEERVPECHPLRGLKKLADGVLERLSPKFDEMYAAEGRASVPPERLLKAMLLMALYTVRSERQLCEQLEYNLLFRWFLDMDMLEGVFDPSVFAKNRIRLIAHNAAGEFLRTVVAEARRSGLMSGEHFTVDGTLIEAWASLKSFRPKDEPEGTRNDGDDDPSNPSVNFRRERRSNQTHASTSDPDARLMRKGFGKEAKLSYSAHALMENRNGLIVELQVDLADGHAERRNALSMLDGCLPGQRRVTLAADKGYDTRDFVEGCRTRNVTPHVAAKTRYSAVDARTTSAPGYAVSQRARKRVEEIFGWVKTVGGLRKTRYVGLGVNQLVAHMTAAAYNLLRMSKLLAQAP